MPFFGFGSKQMDVTVVACGAPKRGMGWYHCKQMLDKRVPGAQLTDVVEPFFLGAGKDSQLGKEFDEWSKKSAKGVAFHKSIGEMPKPKGPKLVMICGRTADNPKLFRDAVDHGFSHIYLEKPGAPSVTELEEMAAYAKAKGVPVFMGYNRNFSKYVKEGVDFAAKNPSGTITLARNDTFNTAESLDECFERNAEGMMKNMMCHELVVLLTYYGLTVDSIQEVIADQTYTCSETRKGFTDFSKVGFTIKTKGGRKYVLRGDRSGGEHAEAVVSIGGKEAFKAIRPDPEIIAQGKALEDAEPGCMPYFYLQDGEYLALKGAVVDHILQQRAGQPEGVASIETAIEGLKVCDFITDALNAPTFEFKLNISNHPCSWGVDYADAPSNPPWEKVIKCIADAGFAGTELGPVGYYDPERLGGYLDSLNLKLVAGNIFEKLEDPSELPGIISKVHKSCQTLQKHGAKFFVIVPHVAPERIATAGRPADAPRLPNDRWAQFMSAIKEVAEVTKSYGIQSTLHPHAGCWCEYEDEVERAMADLPADLVGLCMDTGHFTYAGMNPVEKFKKYATRIPYMHFKDIDGAVLKTLQERKEGFWQGITSGVFCPLGHGLVDYPAMLRTMKAFNYAGWVTVEQDADNKIDDEEAKLMGPFEDCKKNMIYLQSLGVKDPRSATAADSMHSSYCGRFDGSESKHASPAMAAAAKAGAIEEDPSALPTSTKWSVLSSRVEGLVAELSQVVGKVDAYCVSQSRAEGPAMKAVREKMLATPWAEEWAQKRTMFSYGEEMSTDPLEAMLLKQLVFMAAPDRVLEIGMFVGYGSVAMLEASPTTKVVSLEIDPYLKGWLSSCLADAKLPQIAERHEIVLGPALDSIPKLTGKFDMVFVDANKSEYKSYVENLLKFDHLAPGGVIICDNILYNGYPYMHNHFDAQPARRKFGDDIRVFNQWVADHPELEQVVLPVRDGVSIIRRRNDVPPSRSGAPAMPVEAKPQGNLAFVEDTWKIIGRNIPEEEVPLCGVISDSRIDTSKSEYSLKSQDESFPCAWQVESKVGFAYRVVEVPQGSLLDPDCDALVFGHLAYGSAERTAAMARPQRRLVVVDETVYGLYGAKIEDYFKARSVEYEVMVLPMTEDKKEMDMTLKVCKKMKKFNIDRRHEPVIAIGGGVCLDVVGLAASMFRRRTPYIRVPTTCLAYVDASVGAKNGCNFCGSKNRLGTYVPPAAALLDCDFFKTEESRRISSSLGEMAKMAIMKSAELFKLLEDHAPRLIKDRFQSQKESDDVPARVLRLSIETMLEELAPNLWEDSLDRLVDFGHAVGQNLEMVALGTEYELHHGEAVATDMAYMTVLSNVLGLISAAERDRILQMLRTCSVPVHNPLFDRKFFKEAMKDRIANSMGMRLPLPVGIGKARTFNDVKDEDFERAFVEWERLCASTESRMPRPPTIMPARTGVPGIKAYYTFPPAPNALMVDICLREKGVGTAEIKAMEKYVDLPALDNRSAEMLKMNPQGSLPWFVLDDDTVVAETISMMEYVEEVMPENPLVGTTPKDRGVVRQWQRRMEEHYCYPAFYGHRSWTASDDCADDHFMKNFFAQRLNAHHGASLVPKEWKTLCTWAKNRIQWLNRIKQEEAQAKGKASDFIAGDTFTIVDIQVYVTLWFFSEAFPHPPQKILQELQGQVPWVQAWFDRVHARPACVAAREYREQCMGDKPTAQSNAADVPANVKAPEDKPVEPKEVVLQEKTQTQAAEQYVQQMLSSNEGPPLSVPSFDVAGCHYIVTGGSQGLGLEIAQQLKKLGASKIAILARTRSRGEAAAAQLTSGTCTTYFVEADMANPKSLAGAAAEAIQVLGGRVDGLVNAAGTTERGNMMDTTVEMFDKQFDTNTRAPFLLSQAVAKHMIEKKSRGSIVNISSIAAKGGAPFIMAYSASKTALNTLTQNNATELAPHGIRMNAINMGWTYTENENALMVAKGGPNWLKEADAQMPLKRLMRPVDVACTACFLLSPAAQMMTGNVLDLHPDTALGMLSTKTVDSLER